MLSYSKQFPAQKLIAQKIVTAHRARRIGALQMMESLEARQMFSITPSITAPPPTSGPSSQLLARNITQARDGSYEFRVIYTDADGVRASTIDSLDLRVTGPDGYSRGATLSLPAFAACCPPIA